MNFRTQNFMVAPLPKMQTKVQSIINRWLLADTVSAMDIHKMLGTIQYMAPLVPRGRLRFRPIQWWASEAWDQTTEDWAHRTTFPDWVIHHLAWWASPAVSQGLSLKIQDSDFTLSQMRPPMDGGLNWEPQYQCAVVQSSKPEPHQYFGNWSPVLWLRYYIIGNMTQRRIPMWRTYYEGCDWQHLYSLSGTFIWCWCHFSGLRLLQQGTGRQAVRSIWNGGHSKHVFFWRWLWHAVDHSFMLSVWLMHILLSDEEMWRPVHSEFTTGIGIHGQESASQPGAWMGYSAWNCSSQSPRNRKDAMSGSATTALLTWY